ncbi:hypothetical protein CPLU01_09167 [Colletotrichum plurivorum]|uniref:Uncharacterized protein n=1 Tax=Colletotrichum plurivorum TaxID=2175906 RepID=A0A8H6K9K2_9PEZI|nr:hypothetical protein CPLU01_09167 [Colletotrichum plurivorum]
MRLSTPLWAGSALVVTCRTAGSWPIRQMAVPGPFPIQAGHEEGVEDGEAKRALESQANPQSRPTNTSTDLLIGTGPFS